MESSSHRLRSSASDTSFKLSCESILSKLVPTDQSLLSLILSHDDHTQPEIVLPDGRHFYWYLAIGSMINPVSLYLRGITPITSYPATCLDHKIVFRGREGMADTESSPGQTFDGVVHLLSSEHMASLDQLEFGYDRNKVTCVDYQGQSHIVYAYQYNVGNQLETIPPERYLDIIIKGCEYYKVRPEYINRLRDHQPVIPRKQPEHFQVIAGCPTDVFFSEEDLKKHDGSDPSLPLWICINGKILEHIGLPPEGHPDYAFQQNFHKFAKTKLAGQDATTTTARTLYEPLYKLPLTDDDVCDEHRARIEDFCHTSLSSEQNKGYWKPIGRLQR